MSFFDRMSNGWKLGMTSFGIIRENPSLMLFPVLSGTSLLFISLTFLGGIAAFFGFELDAFFVRFETRSNPWLAELQQEMFVELNPKAAAERGISDGDRVWVNTPTGGHLNVQALVTERVAPDTVFLPFHFSGRWQGADMLAYYPAGAHPIVRGEAVNTGTTYGYDSVTMMQETKTTVCQIEKA